MKVSAQSIWVAGAFGTVIGLAANLAVYLIGVLAGVSLVATAGATAGVPISPVQITIMTVMWMLVGIAFAVLLNRWRRLRTAQIVGAVVAVLSLGMIVPAGFDAGSATVLAVMHLISGAAYVLALQWAIRRGAPASPIARQPSEAAS